MIKIFLIFLLTLNFVQAEILNIGIIYGSLGYGNPVFPDWQTALFYASQLIPASENIPGYNLFDYPTHAMVLCEKLINEAGGIPLHDVNNTQIPVNVTFFNINFFSPGAETQLINDLSVANGPYGCYKFIVNVFGTSTSWANACRISGTCIVISSQVPNNQDYICMDPLPSDCITNNLRVGSRRFHNLFSPFYAFDTMHSAVVDLWYYQGMQNVAIFCSPLIGDQIICDQIQTLVADNNMKVVYSYTLNFTTNFAWSIDEASVVVEEMMAVNVQGIFFIAVSNTGLPAWLNYTIVYFVDAMIALAWAPLAAEFQTLAVSNIDPIYSQYLIVSYPFLQKVRGYDFRAINTSNNLEIFGSNSIYDSPAVFIQKFNDNFPAVPEPYAPAAAIFATGMLIIFKVIELTGSTQISNFILQSYSIRTPSHYGLLGFDEVGRFLGETKDIIFGQYVNVGDMQTFYPLTPLSIAQKPIYPMPTWIERTFDPNIRYSRAEKIFFGLTSIAIFYILFFMCIILKYRFHPAIKASSPIFLFIFLVGSILLLCSNFVNTLTQNKTTCSSQVWLLTLGFTLMYGSVFTRILRILYIFNSKQLSGRFIFTDKLLVVPLAWLLIVDLIINLSWLGIKGMNVTYVSVDIYRPYYDYNTCVSDSQTFAYVSLGYKFLCIFGGVVCTFYARNVPAQFNETMSIFSAIYSTLLICTLAVPFVISGVGGREVVYIIQSIAILLLVISLVSFIFLPKLYYVKTNTVSVFTETKKNTYTESDANLTREKLAFSTPGVEIKIKPFTST